MYKWLYFYFKFLLCIQFDVLILLAPVVKTGNHYIDHNLISIEIGEAVRLNKVSAAKHYFIIYVEFIFQQIL